MIENVDNQSLIENINYKEKILIFFDVLGFRNLVKSKYKTDPEQIYNILNILRSSSEPTYNCDTIVFSDSIIQIYDLNCNIVNSEKEDGFNHYFNNILKSVNRAQVNLFYQFGVLIRGAVVIGEIFYCKEKNMLFGDALIDAYELESKIALYPRVLIDSNIVKKINQIDNGKGFDWLDITLDIDGNYYADPFKWAVQLENEKYLLDELKNKATEGLNESNNIPSVANKYNWVLNKIKERECANLTQVGRKKKYFLDLLKGVVKEDLVKEKQLITLTTYNLKCDKHIDIEFTEENTKLKANLSVRQGNSLIKCHEFTIDFDKGMDWYHDGHELTEETFEYIICNNLE
ncbi:hypothetical protein [Lysinibacillus sp. OTC-L20]|uniref:hypothetical protein n=1 Tax=Lysinibacillus sp. OTC-L20 TaxID=3342791 RepID=UPI0035B76811